MMKAFIISLIPLSCPGVVLAIPMRRDNVEFHSGPSRDNQIASPIYIHPSLVVDGNPLRSSQYADSRASLESHWEMPFIPSAYGQILCGNNLTRESQVKNSRVDDCLSAMGVLLGLRGHWDTKGWRNAPGWHRFFGYATCNIWLDSENARISGNHYGDVIP